MIRDRGAESCYIDYHPSFGASPFGKVLCTSVNDAVLHGLPHDYVLRRRRPAQPGLRRARSTAGWPIRPSRSIVGTPRPQDQQLIAVTEAAWPPASTPRNSATSWATSRPRSPGSRTRDGYKINTEFGGHGVGRTMHGDPHVPNNGTARTRACRCGPDW